MLVSRKKRPLTLVEVLLCVGLIALAGSLFATKGKQLWQRHQFFASVDRLCEELVLTRHFSQSLRADVDVFLIPEKNGLRVIRQFDEPGMRKMKNTFASEIFLKNITLSENCQLFFYGNGWHEYDDDLRIKGVEEMLISLSSKNFAAKKFVK